MEPESEMGRSRYRLYMMIGLVGGLAFLVLGIVALVTTGGPVYGWFCIVAGVLIIGVSLLQLRRS